MSIVKDFKQACEKIGGEYEDRDIINRCDLGNAKVEMTKLPEHMDSDYSASIDTEHSEKGSTSAIISGSKDNLNVKYGRQGMHSAVFRIEREEGTGQLSITNQGEDIEREWGI